jgi:hypothetical protein
MERARKIDGKREEIELADKTHVREMESITT